MSLSIAASEGVNELHPPVGGELSSVAARTVKIPETKITLPKTVNIYRVLDLLQLSSILTSKPKNAIFVTIPIGEYNLYSLQQAFVSGYVKGVPADTCELRITATGVYFFSKVQVILDKELADLIGIPEVPRNMILVPVQWGPPSVSIYCDLVDPQQVV